MPFAKFHTTVFQCGLASPLSCMSPRTPGCGTTEPLLRLRHQSSGERLFQSHLMKKNPIHRHPLRPNQPTLSTPSPCSSGRPRENSIRLLSAFSIPHLTWVFLECDERGPSIVIQLRVLDYLSGRSRTPSPRLPTLTILARIRQLCLNDHVQARLADAETRLSCLTRSRAPRSHPLDHADIDYRY